MPPKEKPVKLPALEVQRVKAEPKEQTRL